MRITHLLALASAVGAGATPARAQEPSRPLTENRVRITSPRAFAVESEREPEHRAALGVGTSTTGTLRDTLGLLVTSITKGSPAERAGLEEGNRIAAINGVNLRANAADVEDGEMSSALARRLTRELGKSKPGDEVELKVYRDGRTQTIKVKTADSDTLFRRTDAVRTTQADRDNRPALGFGIGSTGGRRDTLGVLVMSVPDSTPASRAGLEEGNRIAAINGVNLRVAREDAGDRYLGEAKAQRLQREISQLKPGDNVTLTVYSEGKFRDVSMKVARAADLPRTRGGMTYMSGDGTSFGMISPMTPMPPMPPMPAMPRVQRTAPRAPIGPMSPLDGVDGVRIEIGPDVRRSLDEVRAQLRNIEPQLRMQLDRVRPELEAMQPRLQMQLENIRPQMERLRLELPELMDRVRVTPRIRMVNVIV